MAVAAAKQMQSAIQAQQAASAAGLDLLSLSSTIANVRTKGILSLCDAPERATPTDADDDQVEDLGIPLPAESTKYCLRLCIHSGKHFPRERVLVKMVIGEGTEKEKTLRSPTALLSPNPVWEFLVDEEVDYDGKPPNVELKFFGERLFGEGKALGACALPLPAGLTDGPRRQYIKVSNMPRWFLSEKLDPRILVVWQVCNSSEGEPDLLRVAELPAAATEKRKWKVDTHIACLELKRPTAGRQPIQVQLECIRMEKGQKRTLKWKTPSGVSSQPPPPVDLDDGQPVRSISAASSSTSTPVRDMAPEVLAPDCRFALWTDDVNCTWEFHDTQVNLMTAIVRASVYSVRPVAGSEGNMRFLGSWQETLADLMDAVDESNTKLWFDAELKSNEGMRAGRLRMELDAYSGDQVHKSIRPSDSQKNAGANGRLLQLARIDRIGTNPPPGPSGMEAIWGFDEASLRVGMGIAHRRTPAKQITYYCSLFADSLIVANQSCNPYVRITMTTRGDSDVISASTGYDVIWPETVHVRAKSTERKARIEIWNKSSGWGWANDELIGEAMIYEVSPGTTYWCHCFGGAYGAAKEDEAMQMVRGAIKPASTYRGSVAVHFGTRPKQATGFVKTIADMRAPACLIVRLYRGIYLDTYRGKQVSVIVQLAGCGLPGATPDGAKNRSVLSFPGIVDKNGVLRFVPVSSDSLVELVRNQASGATVKSESVAWVERSTPMQEKPGIRPGEPGSVLLRVAPGVTHAYLYIVKLGDEDLPPQVFGRLRLQERDKHHVKPNWKRMRWDRSVVDVDEANDDFAGFILGTAVLMPAQLSEDETEQKGPDVNAHILSKAMNAMQAADSVRNAGSRPSLPAVFNPEDPKLPLLPFEKNLVAQLDPSKKSDLLPSPTKPTSVLCRPFCPGETMVNVGSPGETVHYRLRQNPTTVYCHFDVLAARCLPSMDDDGLADPCYMIRIEDKVRKPQQEETVKSLNPTFMHRFVIPVQVELDDPKGEIFQSHSEPLPPVLFQLWDRDQKAVIEQVEHYARKIEVLSETATLGDHGASYAKIGTVVVKHPRCLDNEKTPRKGPNIDVDSLHEAIWHAVDRPAHTPFEPETKYGIDAAWTQRPRVLLATGYSLRWNPNNPEMKTAPTTAEKFKFRDAAKKWAKFAIEIDLLGLRDLPARMHFPELCITSFWEGGPVKLTEKDWTYKENPQNPNFRPREESTFILEAWKMCDMHAWEYINKLRDFLNQVRPVIPIRQTDLALPDGWEKVPENAKKKGYDPSVSKFLRGVGDGLLSGLASKMKRAHTTVDEGDDDENHMVQLEDVLGIRISAPVYKVPIIPYMQRQTPSIQLDVKYVSLDDDSIFYPYLTYKASRGTVDTTIVPTAAGELGGPSVVLAAHNMSFAVCYANQDDAVEVVGQVTVRKSVAEEGKKTGKATELPIVHADGKTKVGTLIASFTTPPVQVLMPELVIQLRNMYTAYEYGTLSAPLRSLVSEWDMANWSEMAIQEYKNCQLKDVKSLANTTLLEDAYEVFVDVFAATSGHLMWNPDVRMGRFIQNQSLFRISQEEVDDDDDDGDDDDAEAGKKAQSGPAKEPPVWQSFNPMDKICGNPCLISMPFDQRFMPDLVVDRGPDGRRYSLPPTPEEMLGPALRSKAEKAKTWSTKKLRKEALKVKERCVSHLTVPEGREADLLANRKTFIRQVGHQISPDHDRDSRLLARLRLAVNDPTETQHNNNYLVIKFNLAGTVVWAPTEEKTKFDQPGEVLFAVRLDDGSGVLVAVTVPILDLRFPFETGWYLRKTLNNRWKSLANRIESKILAERRKHDRRRPPGERAMDRSQPTAAPPDAQLDAGPGGKGKNAATKGVAAMQTAALSSAAALKNPISTVHGAAKTATKAIKGSKGKEKAPDSDDDQNEDPDGYSLPIPITKNAFVCRLRKRKATHAYDRLRTRNWYRTVLSDVFDEVKGLKEDPEDDLEFVRTQFFARFMNLRQALVTGESQDQQGLIKGHITVKRLPDESSTPVFGALEKRPEESEPERSSIVDSAWGGVSTLIKKATQVGKHGNPANMPICGMRPVENLWISSPVGVEVYVLTADMLKLRDSRTKLTPYLTVSIKGNSEFTATMKEPIDDMPAGSRSVSFYEHFSFMPTMPGVSTLVIQVWDKSSLTGAILQGTVQDQLIGECEVDIEDRWLALAQKQLRAISNQDYLRQQTSPLEVVDVADAKAFLEAMDKDAANPAANASARGRAGSASSQSSSAGSVTAMAAMVSAGVTGAVAPMGMSGPAMGLSGPAPTGPGSTVFETDRFFQLKPKLADTFACFQRKLFHAGDVPKKKEYVKLLRSHWKLQAGKVPEPSSVLVTPELEFQRLDVHRGHEERAEWCAPTKPIRCDAPGTGTLITPHVAPLARLPIEAKDLLKEDEDTGAVTHVGSLRFWVDLHNTEENYQPAAMSGKLREYEIRVFIGDIQNISIFKDFGERNDVNIEGRLSAISNEGSAHYIVKHTDTHKWAQKVATFNWRWVYRVKAPALQCQLELIMRDEDRLSGSDLIYEPKVLNLDHMLMLAHTQDENGEPRLGVNSEKVHFDAWPKQDDKFIHEGCCCYRRKRVLPKPEKATMSIDVEILPVKDADMAPVEPGRVGPEPGNRLTWKSAVQHPKKFVETFLGPTNTKICVNVTIYIIILTFLITLFTLVFLVLQTFNPLISLR